MVTTRQKEGENLAEYTQSFKITKDMLELYIGVIWFY